MNGRNDCHNIERRVRGVGRESEPVDRSLSHEGRGERKRRAMSDSPPSSGDAAP
jgi:hypothetical protein